MKLLLDTNALVDFVLGRQPYGDQVELLCTAAYFGDVQLWASTQSYADAYYVMRRLHGESEVKEALLATLEFVRPCAPPPSALKEALLSPWHDVEDVLVASCIKAVGARLLVTRDREMLERLPGTAVEPSDALTAVEMEHGTHYAVLR